MNPFLSLNLWRIFDNVTQHDSICNDCRFVETVEAKSNNHRRVRAVRFRKIEPGQCESNHDHARLLVLRFQIRQHRVQFGVGKTARRFRGHCQLPPSRFDKHRYMESGSASVFVDAEQSAQRFVENGRARGSNDHTPCRLGRG